MKKTVNINVAGFPFVVNEDAYTLLDEYLKTIEHAFRNVDGSAELISDIESRVAELLIGCNEQGSSIITVEDVEKVITRIGKPEEMVEEDSFIIDTENPDGTSRTINVEAETERLTPPPYIPPLPKPRKQLFRDPQNAMIGGVCSGLAWYLGWDVTWVRLLMVALLILSVTTVGIVYVILWIVVPEARTPLQRMQMMGEQPTMENIAKTVTDNFREDQGEPVKTQTTTAGTVTTIFSYIIKALIILGLVIAIPIFIAMMIGLLGCVFFLIMWGVTKMFGAGMPFEDSNLVNPFVSNIVFWGTVCGIGWVITIGIPLYSLIRKGLNKSPMKKNIRNSLIFVWIVGFMTAALSTGMVISTVYKHETYEYKEYRSRYNEQWKDNEIETEIIDEKVQEAIETALESAQETLDQANKTLNDMRENMQSLTDTISSEALSPTKADSSQSVEGSSQTVTPRNI